MRALVIIPTYEEAETIETVLRRIHDAAPDVHILVIDDDSPDGTADLAEAIGLEIGHVVVLRRERRLGLGSAYRLGFGWGLSHGADALVEMDADLSHDPAALPGILAGLATHDVVIGSRYVPGGSIPDWVWHRRLLSRAGNAYSARMLGLPIRDLTSGYRAYRSGILASIDLDTVRAEGYGFQIEMVDRAAALGARLTEVPIKFDDRKYGKSKMSPGIIAEALMLVTGWGIARRWRKVADRFTAGRRPRALGD